MPKMHGFELLIDEEEEKKVKSGKPRVCFITAYEEFRSEFKETFPTVEEVDCFLRKPIPMPDLVKKVKSQLRLL
jgi:response regulator RpfG family c-di-GMP phosphodiesterase